ncbi:hypothetical protein GCM10023318_59520 [Nocardia callitridis]|uniref:Alpha/beta hydrolase fold-3 domain-containing protein n=1 Tax=Nocardia callitridis TaxID=648753 RepID=A0ABP9L3X2_9NOCA
MTSVPDVPATPSTRAIVAEAATRIGLRPLNCAIPMNPPGVWFARKLIATLMTVGGGPVPRGTTITAVRAGAVRGEWVRAPGVGFGRRAVYYLHGSAYVICSAQTHRTLAANLSHKTGLPVFVSDYRLAPEHPFPAAADDVAAGYRWLLDRGMAPEDLVIAGDSAGGHLALDLLLENARAGRGQPAAVTMFSPLFDLTLGLAAEQQRRRSDPLISAQAASRMPKTYTRHVPDDTPRLRLRIPDGLTLPPMLVQVGGTEMLLADAHAIRDRVRAAGGRCELEVWPGQMHVFQALPTLIPEAGPALDRAADFLRAALAATTSEERVS